MSWRYAMVRLDRGNGVIDEAQLCLIEWSDINDTPRTRGSEFIKLYLRTKDEIRGDVYFHPRVLRADLVVTVYPAPEKVDLDEELSKGTLLDPTKGHF